MISARSRCGHEFFENEVDLATVHLDVAVPKTYRVHLRRVCTRGKHARNITRVLLCAPYLVWQTSISRLGLPSLSPMGLLPRFRVEGVLSQLHHVLLKVFWFFSFKKSLPVLYIVVCGTRPIASVFLVHDHYITFLSWFCWLANGSVPFPRSWMRASTTGLLFLFSSLIQKLPLYILFHPSNCSQISQWEMCLQ